MRKAIASNPVALNLSRKVVDAAAALATCAACLLASWFSIPCAKTGSQLASSTYSIPANQDSKTYYVKRPVRDSQTKVISVTVMRPVREKVTRQITYTQMNVVREQRTKVDPITGAETNYTVARNVPEQFEKTVEYTVTRMVPEQIQKTIEFNTVRFETTEHLRR